MKKMITIGALVALIAMPATALAQTGYYGWSISASPTVSTMNNPANPGAGLQTVYLWFTGGCYPGVTKPGLAAFEAGLTTGGTGWSIIALVLQNGFLNAGSTTSLLLATSCVDQPTVAANILVTADGNPGRVGLTLSNAPSSKAVGVDCETFTEWPWPTLMRFTGYATNDGSPIQDHGSDCVTTPVEDHSWGAVKALYR